MAITWKKVAYEDDCLLEADFANKGDLLSASAAGALSVLGVGANNKALVADSGEASGLKWDAPDPAAHDIVDNHTATGEHGGDYVNIDGSTPGKFQYRTPAQVAADLALDNIGVPDSAVDFDLQEATDLVVMTVANEAALPAANVAKGQLCWATGELSLHICTAEV